MSSAVARWWLIRHAPVPCPHGRIHGQLDVACDVSDEDDFRQLAQRVPSHSVLLESGLMRCRQTSGALEAAGLVLPPPVIEPDLMEQSFGRWQGRSWTDLEAVKEDGLMEFWRDPARSVPPGGESFAQVCTRVAATLERVSATHAGRDIVAVIHAGPIRAALALALGLDPAQALRVAIAPLSLTRLDAIGDGWRVECVNVTAV